MKKVALHNLGCKVNAYEMEAMEELLRKNGYEIVPFEERADIYIVNTCTVTQTADHKSRQMLHRARKRNPDAIVVAAGCYVQSEDHPDPAVDLVVGNNQKKEIVPILEAYMQDHRTVPTIPAGPMKEYEELSVHQPSEHTRAYVKIQDGCDAFCSYCIIPYVRGRARSRDADHVLQEVQALAENGYQEVVLTGIQLSAYGKDLGVTLPELIGKLHAVPGIRRIRLGSLEPTLVTEDFVKELADLPKVCPHFHLSLQSGCDATLTRMNRHYTAQTYAAACERLRAYFPDPALTTDVIVGFPGESEAEFAASFSFIDQMDFYEIHVFKYSKRAGTKAASLPNPVPESVKGERSQALLSLSQKKQARYEEKLLGTTQEVLMEEAVTVGETTYQVGHTRTYVKVGVQTDQDLRNQMVQAEILSPEQIFH